MRVRHHRTCDSDKARVGSVLWQPGATATTQPKGKKTENQKKRQSAIVQGAWLGNVPCAVVMGDTRYSDDFVSDDSAGAPESHACVAVNAKSEPATPALVRSTRAGTHAWFPAGLENNACTHAHKPPHGPHNNTITRCGRRRGARGTPCHAQPAVEGG